MSFIPAMIFAGSAITRIPIFAWIALVALTLTGFAAQSFGQAPAFPVFDATLYKDKPDLTKFGVPPLQIAYGSDLWSEREARDEVPRWDRVREIVREGSPGNLLVVDIEHWPLRGDNAVVQESIRKYIETLVRFRTAAPSRKIGFYSMVPQRAYWPAVAPETSPRYRRWQRDNDAAQQIAEQADIIFPSLYTFYPYQTDWVRYATANLREARRVAPGKPVYCFLWPQYHDSTRRAYEFLPVDYWKEELRTCRRLADGIVIWGGVGENGRMTGWLPWDNEAPWWKATVDFVASVN